MKPNQKFYDVVMRVEVTRRVLASFQHEADGKADKSDMIHEIKSYGFNEEIIINEVEDAVPTEYDLIDDIGQQIYQNKYAPFHQLKAKYAEIQEINRELAKIGKTPGEPFIFNRLTDEFLDKLRS